MKNILGLDIGIASVGWAVVSNDGNEILESGVRLFESADPSKNENRREKRGVRRNSRRRKNRLKDVTCFLEEKGFNKPINLLEPPVYLRNKGLEEKLTKEEIFVALYNLVKHRGVSYIEDIEEMQLDDKASENFEKIKNKLPCEIQLERFEHFGLYRGTNLFDGQTLINTFTTSMYEKEAVKILEKQREFYKEINDEFINSYINILKRKREYYIGPGNDLSRTNYGVYKTTGVTLDNLFDELRGSCSIYNGKEGMEKHLRASGASYTAQYYNLLNDLCNIRYKGEKLTKEQKIEVIEIVKNNNTSMKITAALKKLYKYSPEDVAGFRVDKKGAEENHSFEVFRAMRKDLLESNIDIGEFSVVTLDAVADILTINTETDGMLKYFNNKERVEYQYTKDLLQEEIDAFINIRRKRKTLFSKWSSFSYKLINQVMPEMLETGDEQHTCITRMKIKKYSSESKSKIDYKEIIDEIYNPVVSRSIVQTIKIINELSKKYEFSDIVVEMPRDRNEKEEKENISKMQKNNEDEKKKALSFAGISESEIDFRVDKKIMEKLRLYYKQNGRCLYSGEMIKVTELLNGSFNYEIDHIIPISVSFDDSISNKVLVLSGYNKDKSNQTPYQFLSSGNSKWTFLEYKSYVEGLYKDNRISRKHLENLLNQKDITKQEVVQGFINRNINDTRYASKVVLNELQTFYKNSGKDTKIKVIKGVATSQFRKNMKLNKDRDEDFKHHAEDAMICCFTQISLNKFSNDYVNLETGEVLNKGELLKLNRNDRTNYLSLSNFDTSVKIKQFRENIKISHKIDTKVNRELSDATIYGTRKKDDAYYVVSKIKNIYDKKEFEKFTKKYKKDATQFLMYQHDIKTWEKLMKIIDMYPNSDNPFQKYKEEFGPITKYAKKDNGPAIKELKYLDNKLGTHIDISNNYYGVKNKVALLSLKPYRADVFYDSNKKQYNLVPIKYSDFKFEKGKYILPTSKYEDLLKEEKVLKENETIEDLNVNRMEFKFSLYKNNIIELTEKDISTKYRFLAKNHSAKNYFEVKEIDKKNNDRIFKGLTKTIQKAEKYNVDILGNYHKVEKEKLILEFTLDNVMI